MLCCAVLSHRCVFSHTYWATPPKNPAPVWLMGKLVDLLNIFMTIG